MKLEPIKDLVEAGTDLVFGRDLFIYAIPTGVDSALGLFADDSDGRVDYEIPGVYYARFQAISRSVDYLAAEARAYEVFHLLKREQITDLGTYCLSYIRPMHLPIPYRRSPADIVEFSTNFRVRLFIP